MFEVGKKYMFSKRKFMRSNKSGGKNNVSDWVSNLVGIKFTVTEESIGHLNSVGVESSTGCFLSVIMDWCIPIK